MEVFLYVTCDFSLAALKFSFSSLMDFPPKVGRVVYVHIYLIHFMLKQKLTQCCKAIILQ